MQKKTSFLLVIKKRKNQLITNNFEYLSKNIVSCFDVYSFLKEGLSCETSLL